MFNVVCRAMLEASSDNRGTLQQLAEDLDEVYADGKPSTSRQSRAGSSLMTAWTESCSDSVSLSFSPRFSRERIPEAAYFAFLVYMNTRYPLQPYHSDIAIPINPQSKMISATATVFDYVVVGGHRYHAASRATSAENSYALIRTSGAGATWVGQVQHIVLYEDGVACIRELYAHVLWFCPGDVSLAGTPWEIWCVRFLSSSYHQC